MGIKGSELRVFDPATTNEVIIRTNRYKQLVEDKTAKILQYCNQMNNEDILVGGAGGELVQSLQSMTEGCDELRRHVHVLVTMLNTRLGMHMEHNAAAVTASAREAVDSANKSFQKKE